MAIRNISHIVAVSENNVIGVNGELPWHLSDDFRFFKNLTWAMPVIMGRKTFDSMGKILPGRINIVITSQKDWSAPDAYVVHDLTAAIHQAEDADTKEIFIIGGGRIFHDTSSMINCIYLTRVHITIEGDTHYPAIDETQWKKISETYHPKDEKHQYDFTFETWERKQ